MDQQRWAAAHYRVERESTGVMMRKRQRKKATELAIEHGDPIPDSPGDVVRIVDRAGEVVFEQDWRENRPGAMAQEAQIVDDLLKLEVGLFRSKYGITDPEGEETASTAASPAADPWADAPPPHDPWADTPPPGRATDAEPGSAGAS